MVIARNDCYIVRVGVQADRALGGDFFRSHPVSTYV